MTSLHTLNTLTPSAIAPAQAFASLTELLESSFDKFKDRPAYTLGATTLSYGQVDTMTRRLAAAFTGLGLQRGARIGVMLPNIPQQPITVFAGLRAGLVIVNINPLYTSRELQQQLADSGALCLVILEQFLPVAEEVLNQTAVTTIIVVSPADLVANDPQAATQAGTLPTGRRRFGDLLRESASLPGPLRHAVADDVAFLQYTGGTTGVSKGAALTHGNLASVIEQTLQVVGPALDPKGDGDYSVLTALPLYHVFALIFNGLCTVRLGGRSILIANPRDLDGMVATLAAETFHAFSGVNTLFNALLQHRDFQTINWATLRFAVSGGMAMSQATAQRWERETGCPVSEAYGLTETSATVAVNALAGAAPVGSVGKPIPHTLIRIVDDDGSEVARGQRGEVCIKGPQVMRGYWNNAAETAMVMTHDGFLRSGDVGYLDDTGGLHIVDRKKEVIVVSGFKVYPSEVEQVVALHPSVLEAAVIGVEDAHTGEAVKLVVVARDSTLTTEDLAQHCAKNLARYKCPKLIELRSTLPKSAVGKVLKRAL